MLRENTEKYFSVPINKELNNDKTITYEIRLIDSFRFMSSSLSNFVDNLAEGFHNKKCKDCKSCLEYIKITMMNYYLIVQNVIKTITNSLIKA